MWNKRKQILQELTTTEHRLHYQEAVVNARRNELLSTMQQHAYLLCICVLVGAFVVGWKTGKRFDIQQFVKTAFMLYLNAY